MIVSRILDVDAELGKTQIHHYDTVTEESTIETQWDTEPVLEHASILRTGVSDYRPYSKGNWHHVGLIPNWAVDQMTRDGSIHDNEAIARWLADNSKFKLIGGRY